MTASIDNAKALATLEALARHLDAPVRARAEAALEALVYAAMKTSEAADEIPAQIGRARARYYAAKRAAVRTVDGMTVIENPRAARAMKDARDDLRALGAEVAK